MKTKLFLLVLLLFVGKIYATNDIVTKGSNDKKTYWGFGLSTNIFCLDRGFDAFNYYASTISDNELAKSNVIGVRNQGSTGFLWIIGISIVSGMLWLYDLNITADVWTMFYKVLTTILVHGNQIQLEYVI